MQKTDLKNLSLTHRAFYAQAVADAMGERFEFHHPSPKVVRALMHSKESLNISDDTQMAMFGQEALNELGDQTSLPILINARYEIERAYLRWYETQTGFWDAETTAGLLARPEMHARRAPGGQCLAALGQLWRMDPTDTLHGRGCGSVMRLLPFAALLTEMLPANVLELALKSARVTHSHPESDEAVELYINSAALLIEGCDRKHIGMSGRRITSYGQGWLALECVEMALWAVERALNYDHLLELCICHGGDSDSVAAVAGGLWGLAGLGGWERYVPRLVERKAIDSLFEV